MRKSIVFTMNSLSDIKTLNAMADRGRAYGTVILKKGSFCIDAASLLGIISLDPTSPTICEFEEENIGLDNFLQKFRVE